MESEREDGRVVDGLPFMETAIPLKRTGKMQLLFVPQCSKSHPKGRDSRRCLKVIHLLPEIYSLGRGGIMGLFPPLRPLLRKPPNSAANFQPRSSEKEISFPILTLNADCDPEMHSSGPLLFKTLPS